jgi:hypothetical protein
LTLLTKSTHKLKLFVKLVSGVLQLVQICPQIVFDAAQALKKSPLKSTRNWPRLESKTTAIAVSHLCDCGRAQ